MAPGQHNLIIYAGETFARSIRWQDSAGVTIDLTTYAARLTVRDAARALIVELSTENGRIAHQVDGGLRLTLDDAITRALPPGGYAYDLVVREPTGGTNVALLQGRCEVRALVTTVEPGVTP